MNQLKCNRLILTAILICVLLAPQLSLAVTPPAAGNTLPVGGVPAAVNPVRVQEMLLSQPLSFIPNQGQAPSEVKYHAVSDRHSVMLTTKGVVMRLPAEGSGRRLHTLRLAPVGLNPKAELTPLDPMAGKANFFKGRDPKQWRTNLPTYGAILYREAYPGIDLKVYGTGRHLEYDVIVKPGADPSRVRFRATGIKRLTVNDQGDLVLTLPGGASITQKKPVVYQEIDGRRVPREGRFQVAAGKPVTYGFALGLYDRRYPLIIDPLVVVYSVTFGTSGYEGARGVAIDQSGNAYVTGYTYSSTFPVTAGACQTSFGGIEDAFVMKLDSNGAILAATFLGGGSYDSGEGIALDSGGNVYVVGNTESGNFPATAGAYQTAIKGNADAFAAKLNNSLSTLHYATYLGGYGNNVNEFGDAIAVNQSGEAYVAGKTGSTTFPTTTGAWQTNIGGLVDTFVTRLNDSGSGLLYSTYLGGSGWEECGAIAVDSSGCAYVVGNTESTNFPRVKSLQEKSGPTDAFVAKLLPDGSGLVYSTYLGGSGTELGMSIAVDTAGVAYVCGDTTSADFPRVNPIQGTYGGNGDGFVAKLALAGESLTLVYSTYLGGSEDEEVDAIAVDQQGAAYVTGETGSADFPSVKPLPGITGPDFLTKINPAGTAWAYSTRLPIRTSAIALDASGPVYLAGGPASVLKLREEAEEAAVNIVGAIYLLLEN
jgi:hypothetical protein